MSPKQESFETLPKDEGCWCSAEVVPYAGVIGKRCAVTYG